MSQKTVLIVEDHNDTRIALKLVLRKEGHTILVATTAHEGTEMALENNVDLLISDIGLPDGSGWNMMEDIRAKKFIAGIALSGFGTDNDREKSLAAGFSEHLIKPFDVSTLLESIRKILGHAQQEGQ